MHQGFSGPQLRDRSLTDCVWQVGIAKLKRLLEHEAGESNFTPDLYMHLYT